MVTTTESIKTRPDIRCSRCGHGGGLFLLDANHKEVHERGGCPDGPARVETPDLLIAHDALDMLDGEKTREVRAKALGHLQAHGQNLTLTKNAVNQSGNDAVAVTNPAGREDSGTRERVVGAGEVVHAVKQAMRPAADLLYEQQRFDAEVAAQLLRPSRMEEVGDPSVGSQES